MSPIDTNLTNQVALVTGGSQGIGAATAVTLAEAGASVAITYNQSETKAMDVVKEIQHKGSRGIVLPLDLRDEASIRTMVSQAKDDLGRIDIFVNNAAVGSASVAHYANLDKQDRAMVEINTLGALLCAEAVLPIMVEQNYGKIINISSVGGGVSVFPQFRRSDGMSKAAVAFLSKQIVADYPHHQIDAFTICPGAVDTRMFRESTLDPLPAQERDALIMSLPLGRLIKPQEIADLILFLCSPQAVICRGAIIDASLGLGVRPGLISEKKSTEP
jgi:NAD(P)-dependent dehydrogenase (short-subunit alcohol dehydrogenase family)